MTPAECKSKLNETSPEFLKGIEDFPKGEQMVLYLCTFVMTDAEYLATAVMRPLISFVGTILNVLLLYKCLCKRSVRKKVPNVLLAHQAIVDLYNLVVYVPASLKFGYTHEETFNDAQDFWVWYLATNLLYELSIFTSMFNFILISVERFLSLWKPFYHRAYVTCGRVYRMALLVWVLSGIVQGICVVGWFTNKVKWYNRMKTGMLLAGFIVVTGLTLAAFFKARQSLRRGKNFKYVEERSANDAMDEKKSSVLSKLSLSSLASFKSSISSEELAKEFQLTLLFCLMYSCFCWGFLPLMIIWTWTYLVDFNSFSIDGRPIYFKIASNAFILSSMLNPLLAMWLKKDLRQDWGLLGNKMISFVNCCSGCRERNSCCRNTTGNTVDRDTGAKETKKKSDGKDTESADNNRENDDREIGSNELKEVVSTDSENVTL